MVTNASKYEKQMYKKKARVIKYFCSVCCENFDECLKNNNFSCPLMRKLMRKNIKWFYSLNFFKKKKEIDEIINTL